ncbi:HD domain-containing phosphohydrolase [Fusibacter sp. JL298sf-3]
MGQLDFLKDEPTVEQTYRGFYKIMIADDDEEVHTITKMILKDFVFEDHGLTFIDAYTGAETIELLKRHPDTAVLFLDVVMEDVDAGLKVVDVLRSTLQNRLTRIVLRTGQPGEAPEETVIEKYDINDYRLKTEMTVKRLFTTLYTALRGYRDLKRIDRHKMGLEKIIETSANLFKHNSLNAFLTSILSQLSGFYYDYTEMVYVRSHSGFVTLSDQDTPMIVAATGKYTSYIGKPIFEVDDLREVGELIRNASDEGIEIIPVEQGFLIRSHSNKHMKNYIFIEGNHEIYDFELIKLFLANYSVALDNFILNNLISSTQKEIIFTLGEVVESHFEETGGHVKRISEMMYRFARRLDLGFQEAEILKIASTMHDIGKIAIPDAILKKPGRLSDSEYEVIQSHAFIGYKILSKSNLEILKVASEIAHWHHEKYDGTGYPDHLSEKAIPLNARMLAIVDVFDAMTHRRVYKEASTVEEALDYLNREKGRHFDPELVTIFTESLEDIIEL